MVSATRSPFGNVLLNKFGTRGDSGYNLPIRKSSLGLKMEPALFNTIPFELCPPWRWPIRSQDAIRVVLLEFKVDPFGALEKANPEGDLGGYKVPIRSRSSGHRGVSTSTHSVRALCINSLKVIYHKVPIQFRASVLLGGVSTSTHSVCAPIKVIILRCFITKIPFGFRAPK